MKWDSVLLGILLIFLAMLYGKELSSVVFGNQSAVQSLSPGDEDYLMNTLDVSTYDRMSEKNQVKVRRAVQYFCEIKWHEDSCLSHLITCGKKCFPLLKPSAQSRSRRAFSKRLEQI